MAKASKESDDDSSLFFILALLATFVLPWTFSVVRNLLFPGAKNVAQAFPDKTADGNSVRHCKTQKMSSTREVRKKHLSSRSLLFTRGWVFRAVVLAMLWFWLLYIVVQVRTVLATSERYQNFDPFEILGVGRSTTQSDIKKAFRKLSLKYHPDKDPSPAAKEKFLLAKKAHDSLADPVGKKNFELYGNPDGPSRMEMGHALPTVSKENQGLVLVLFVVIFIIGVPLTLVWCMGSGEDGDYCENGVLRPTMELLHKSLQQNPSITMPWALDLLLASGESACFKRPSDENDMVSLRKELPDKGRLGKATSQENAKAEVLLAAHLYRRHNLLSQELKKDLDALLLKWRLVLLGLADLAAKTGNAEAVTMAMSLHRCLVQALEPKAETSADASLLQVPHFSVDVAKSWRKGSRKNALLPQFLEMTPEERKSSLEGFDGLGAQEMLDIDEFAVVAPSLEMKDAKVVVEGENNIQAGDLATLILSLERTNLRAGEAAGCAHTPLFPSAEVTEAWWLLLTLPGGGMRGARVLCARVSDAGRTLEARMKFRVPTTGKLRCKLQLVCEAYASMDQEHPISFEAKPPTDGSDDD